MLRGSSVRLLTTRLEYGTPARVVKQVDTADLKSADAETRRAGSSPAPGTRRSSTYQQLSSDQEQLSTWEKFAKVTGIDLRGGELARVTSPAGRSDG